MELHIRLIRLWLIEMIPFTPHAVRNEVQRSTKYRFGLVQHVFILFLLQDTRHSTRLLHIMIIELDETPWNEISVGPCSVSCTFVLGFPGLKGCMSSEIQFPHSSWDIP
jgi:hypothetical protein